MEEGEVVDLSHFDLSTEKGVADFATELGRFWSREAIVPIVSRIPHEHLGIFFGYLFAAPFGNMTATIGLENLEAVVKVLLTGARAVAASRAAGTRH